MCRTINPIQQGAYGSVIRAKPSDIHVYSDSGAVKPGPAVPLRPKYHPPIQTWKHGSSGACSLDRMTQYSDNLKSPIRLLLEHLTRAGVNCISAADILTAIGRCNSARHVQMAISELLKAHGWHRSDSRMVHGVRGTFYVKDPRQIEHVTASADVLATAPKAPAPAREPAPEPRNASRATSRDKDQRGDRCDDLEDIARQTHDMQHIITGILETFEGWKWWFRSHGVKIPNDCRMPVRDAPTGKAATSCLTCTALATRLERIENILRAAGADIPTADTPADEPQDEPQDEPAPENATAP